MAETIDDELHPRQVRSVYLITYSSADVERFPTRESFALAVVNVFGETAAEVLQWVCCKEKHVSEKYHFHIAVKLNKNNRWLTIKNKLILQHQISVHFSSVHPNYYSAWQYVTKADKKYIESENHPDLTNTGPPRTLNATNTKRKAASSLQQTKKPCVEKRLTNADVSDIIVKHKITNRTELLVLAKKQKELGKLNLSNYILNKGIKKALEVIDTTWEMDNAEKKLKRGAMSRIDILEDCLNERCVDGCKGIWLAAANDILNNNNITPNDFASAIHKLLKKGRGKYRNLFITGPANCGKTFLLNPLTEIFHCFVNPASTTFAWVGAEEAEVIFLNDFRWSSQLIPWHDLLLLLEGQPVHLPAPKSHFSKDILLTCDTPIFCTSSQKLSYIKNGAINERETEMMLVRWNTFELYAQIPHNNQVNIKSCKKCFANLILRNDF